MDLTRFTSLPNLHPAVVHFPIALLPMAILFDLVALKRPWRSWAGRAAATVYAAAAVGAVAAFLAGREAVDSLVDVAPRVQPFIARHADWGGYSMWSLIAVAVLKLGLTFWDPEGERGGHQAVIALCGIIVLGVVAYTADLGGGLVYEHHVTFSPPPVTVNQAPEETAPRHDAVSNGELGHHEIPEEAAGGGEDEPHQSRPEARLTRGEGGTVTWEPLARDAGALGTILEPTTDSSRDAISAVSPSDPEATGLRLEVSGRSILLLPDSVGDVQLDLQLDVSGFSGTVGLAHHVQESGRAGLLTLALPDGELALRSVPETGKPTILDEVTKPVPDDRFELSVSAAGSHLKGLVDGATVVHGHEHALPRGRCGLLLDGDGELTIHSLTLTPIPGT